MAMTIHFIRTSKKRLIMQPMQSTRYRFRWRMFLTLVSLVCLTCGLRLFTTATAEDAPATKASSQPVLRYDPLSQSLKPLEKNKIIPGKIYNHFSPAHNRYVWAYALHDGKWSYPLGPGTTELPDHFDLVTPPALTRALLEQRAGEWLARSRQEGSPILARLAADDHWELLEFRSVRSHFDLNSGHRWEWHGEQRIGVLHSHGRRWKYVKGHYQPAF